MPARGAASGSTRRGERLALLALIFPPADPLAGRLAAGRLAAGRLAAGDVVAGAVAPLGIPRLIDDQHPARMRTQIGVRVPALQAPPVERLRIERARHA
jgi:hypothetical protein